MYTRICTHIDRFFLTRLPDHEAQARNLFIYSCPENIPVRLEHTYMCMYVYGCVLSCMYTHGLHIHLYVLFDSVHVF